MNDKEKVNGFIKQRSVLVSFCKACEIYTVHCPECQANYCGVGCSCNKTFLKLQQHALDVLFDQ